MHGRRLFGFLQKTRHCQRAKNERKADGDAFSSRSIPRLLREEAQRFPAKTFLQKAAPNWRFAGCKNVLISPAKSNVEKTVQFNAVPFSFAAADFRKSTFYKGEAAFRAAYYGETVEAIQRGMACGGFFGFFWAFFQQNRASPAQSAAASE